MSFWNKLSNIFRNSKKVEKSKNFDNSLETIEQYRERWRSIFIIYFTMFLMSLGFSIIVTGVWPYLDKLDPSAGKEFMGLIIAANPFAQMLFSPLAGWWSNKLGSIRIPLIFSLSLFATANALYSCLEMFEVNVKHWMLWSRFLVGVSSANVAVCRSYLSSATKYSERTKAVAMISLAQVLGFVIGPAIQAAVVPLGNDGLWIIPDKLRFNMYTATGWINVLLALFNIYLFIPAFFKEHKISIKEAMQKQGRITEEETWKNSKPDYFCSWTLIIAFFVMVFNFMLLETLGTPLTMDQLSWSKSQSLWYMGIVMSLGALCSIITFTSIGPLSKRFSEVKMMIWIGFASVLIANLVCIPYSGLPPRIYDVQFKLDLTAFCERILKNETLSPTFDYEALGEKLINYNVNFTLNQTIETDIRTMTLNCGDDLLGCPSTQEWCQYTPALTYFQFITSYILTILGYPIGVTLIQTLFSKHLGSRPQGLWMGLLVGSGCFSRVLGPIFVTYVYEELGTFCTFAFMSSLMLVSLLWLLCFCKRLEPHELVKRVGDERNFELEGKVAECEKDKCHTWDSNI